MSNTSKAIKGMSSQTIVTAILGIVEIVSFSIMSRLLTEEDFGYYAAISAITTIFASLSETGIGSAIVQQKGLSKRYINNAFTLSLLFGMGISFALFVLAGPLSRSVANESIKIPLMLISSTLLLNCLTSVNISLMQRRLQFFRIGFVRLVSLITTTIVAIGLAYKGYGYYAILTKAILSAFITYFLSLVLCKTHFGLCLDRNTFKTIFSFSGWLMASVLFRNLAHQIDRLLLPKLLSVSDLGAYNRPKDFVGQISDKVCGIFDITLFPVLSGIQDNNQALRSSFNKSLFLINQFGLLLSLAFMFNSDLLIRIFFGEQWLYLQPVMFVVSLSVLFNFDGRLADCYLRSLALTKQQFFFRVFETILGILAVFIGYRSGILGVAISFVIANTVAKFIKIYYVGWKIKTKPGEITRVLFSSWRYSTLLLPFLFFAYVWLPSSWYSDIGMLILFIVLVSTVFLFLPGFVGKEYKEEVYSRIISFVKLKIH